MENCLHKLKIFKYGFTLAEVLITLVIIGVIAALTIPTAINNTKDQELKSQFAKAYSTISQALYKTEMNDFYGYARCYYPFDSSENRDGLWIYDDCPAFYNAFTKNLSVQKVCKGNALANGCIPVYKSYNTDSTGCGGFTENIINNTDYSYVLSNGQIIITYRTIDDPLFLFDINGMKGPNAYGKDLFAFQIRKRPNTGLYTKSGICEFPVSGGRTTQQMIQYSLAGKK